jgi:hypothetical protein
MKTSKKTYNNYNIIKFILMDDEHKGLCVWKRLKVTLAVYKDSDR